MKKIISLKGRNLFKEVYNRGTRAQVRGLKIFVLDKNTIKSPAIGSFHDEKSIRIGITVNRKYGKAAERNKAKRRIRAVFRSLGEDLNDGILMIIRVDGNFKELGFHAIKPVLQKILHRTGAIR